MSRRRSDYRIGALFIFAGVNFKDSDYDGPFQTGFDYVSGHEGGRHQWAEQTSLHLQALATRYENGADAELTIDSLDAQTSFLSQYIESPNILLLAGWVNVEADSGQVDPSVTFRPQICVWSRKLWLVPFCLAPGSQADYQD